MVVAGTRPEFIKLAPVILQLRTRPRADIIFAHSGQHFDNEMSKSIIRELELPEPTLNFSIGNRPDASQISRALSQCQLAIRRYEPEIVLAEGDTNTVVAVALAAAKAGIPFAHVEAGLRSFDRTMPEEINRIVADSCSELCFCPTETSAVNLCREGVLPNRISITGNTIVDSCQMYLPKALSRSHILQDIGAKDPFGLVTIHRQENVDNPRKLSRLIDALCRLDDIDLVFPIHPRTRKRLEGSTLWQRTVRSPHLIVCNPLGYLDFLRILTSSAVVLTDSGGVQEEALTLRVPCLTLRENTERPETVLARGNKLVGTQPELIKSSVVEILTDRDKAVSAIARQNPLGDGKAGARITDLCIDYAVGVPFEDGLRDREMIGITAVTVRAPYDGMTVAELRERMGRVITMVYDGLGQPIFPREDICLEEGWTVCLLGNLPGLRPTSQIMRDVKRVRLDGERRC